MTVTCREELSGKRSFINRSLTGAGRSGRCQQSEVLMASPTPCILSERAGAQERSQGRCTGTIPHPTLSAAEARIQWYGKPVTIGDFLGHDVCSALPCSLHSTPLAVATFMTVGTKSFSFAHSAGSSLRMLG